MKVYVFTLTLPGLGGAPFVALFEAPPTPLGIVAAMKDHVTFKEAPVRTVVLSDLAGFPDPESLRTFFEHSVAHTTLDWKAPDGSAHYALQLMGTRA